MNKNTDKNDVLKDFPFKKVDKIEKALIIAHRHADLDAYAASYGIASLLKRLNSKIDVVLAAPQGYGSLVKHIKSFYPYKITEKPDFSDNDLIVIVDTGDPHMLEEWLELIKKSKSKKILIDHHPISDSETIVNHNIIRDTYTSTCEIVIDIFDAKKIKIPQKVAEVLLLGILADSGHLTLAECTTIGYVSKLCKSGASISKARKLISIKRDRSEKIARLKAGQRLRIYKSDEWLFAVTSVGSFHASGAKALLDIGADIALAIGNVNEEVRGSFRATRNFSSKTGIHTGIDLAHEIGKQIKGTGGGHKGASSFSGKMPIKNMIDMALTMISKKIDADLVEVT